MELGRHSDDRIFATGHKVVGRPALYSRGYHVLLGRRAVRRKVTGHSQRQSLRGTGCGAQGGDDRRLHAEVHVSVFVLLRRDSFQYTVRMGLAQAFHAEVASQVQHERDLGRVERAHGLGRPRRGFDPGLDAGILGAWSGPGRCKEPLLLEDRPGGQPAALHRQGQDPWCREQAGRGPEGRGGRDRLGLHVGRHAASFHVPGGEGQSRL